MSEVPLNRTDQTISHTLPKIKSHKRNQIEQLAGGGCLALGSPRTHEIKSYLAQCINEMVSLKSIHPQTRQLNFVTRNSKIKSTGLKVN